MIFDESRYIRTPLVERDGVAMLQIRERHNFNLGDATPYEWHQGDTLDGVSYAFYETTDFRWAILDANPKYRTEFDINNGDIVYIPDYEEILEIVDV